jgi:hypothetical protein
MLHRQWSNFFTNVLTSQKHRWPFSLKRTKPRVISTRTLDNHLNSVPQIDIVPQNIYHTVPSYHLLSKCINADYLSCHQTIYVCTERKEERTEISGSRGGGEYEENSFVEVDRSYRNSYCVHHQDDEISYNLDRNKNLPHIHMFLSVF